MRRRGTKKPHSLDAQSGVVSELVAFPVVVILVIAAAVAVPVLLLLAVVVVVGRAGHLGFLS